MSHDVSHDCCRLEAELEEARRRHEEEMRVELERQEAEAQQRMDAELEKKRLEAADQLNKQRHLYEDRLAELNKLLVSQCYVSVSFVKG